MAKRKMTKKQRREVEKVAKKHPLLILVIALLIIALVTCCVLHRKRVIHIPFLDGIIPQEKVEEDKKNEEENGGESEKPDDGNQGGGNVSGGDNVAATGGAFSKAEIEEIKGNDLSIHFLELGNRWTGDCTLIKVGDTEVLIDAGSRKGSAATIKEYVDGYCTDGVLEYVIATHAHQDHIAGFVGNKNGNTRTGIFYQYEIGTLIQFSRSEQSTTTDSGGKSLYGEYLDAVEMLEGKGTTVYTALECWQGNDATEGARKKFVLDAEKDIALNILYQKYYEQDASDENEYSVCTLLSQGTENHYLFTGDLGEHGEGSLIESNELPKVKLFKAGHHGSYTANSAALMAVIQPEVVCVCCCCGSDEYKAADENLFPSQTFTDNVAPYTDQIYVTSIVTKDEAGEDNGCASMNGTIVVLPKNGEIRVRCSNNATKFKDTEWFAQYRTWNAA